RKVLDEHMSKLRRRYDASRVLFEPLDAAADGQALRDLPGVVAVQALGGEFELRLAAGVDPAAVMREAVARLAPARVEIARLRLEDSSLGLGREDTDSAQALREHL